MTTNITTARKTFGAGALVALAVLFIGVTILITFVLRGARIDLTESNLYSIAPGTQNIVSSLKEPINLYFFFSDHATENMPALRTYANNLGAALSGSGSNIRVSSVHPYVMRTALATHPNPIYTRPVNANGLTGDKPFDDFLGAVRGTLDGGLDPSMVGETYAQLLSMTAPPPNVAVGSPDLAIQGQNELITSQVLADNDNSAIPLVSI